MSEGDRPRTLGVTGGIGTGKSAFCRFLTDLFQLPLIDADRLGHEALRVGSTVHDALLARFGEGVLDRDGSLDRGALGMIVFDDPAALDDLNRLVHPWILERIETRVAALKASGYTGIILIDAALLLQWLDRFRPDGIVLVTAPLEARLARLEARGVDRDEALRRIESQWPEAEWRPHADWIVDNSGSLEDLAREARSLLKDAHSRWGIEGEGEINAD